MKILTHSSYSFNFLLTLTFFFLHTPWIPHLTALRLRIVSFSLNEDRHCHSYRPYVGPRNSTRLKSCTVDPRQISCISSVTGRGSVPFFADVNYSHIIPLQKQLYKTVVHVATTGRPLGEEKVLRLADIVRQRSKFRLIVTCCTNICRGASSLISSDWVHTHRTRHNFYGLSVKDVDHRTRRNSTSPA